MKHYILNTGLRPLATALLAAGTLSVASQAVATTAADTTIRNSVMVNYADTAGNAQTALTAIVDVTVNLVRANPVLNAPANQSTDSATNAVYAYTITTAANGLTSYALSTPLSQSAGISGSTAGASVATVTLGATTVASSVTIAAAGTTVINVPRDNTADATINGLQVGDTVVIGGQVFTVAGIGADTIGVGVTTISVNGNGTALTANAGTLIAERQTFNLTVDPGTVNNATVDQTITVTATATDSVDNTKLASDVTVTTVLSVGLSVQKLVRNVNYAAGAGGNAAGLGAVVYDLNTYYTGGVTGNPGEVLEYMIVVTKSTTTASATAVRVSDPVPPFTTFVANSLVLDNGGGLPGVLNDSGSDTDAGEFGGNAVYFYPGTGGSDGGLGAPGVGDGIGGELGPNAVSHALFRVSID